MAPTPGSEDAALLARLRAGDEDAFELVVRTYSGRLLSVTRRILCNDEDARDAVQDALLSAFRSLDRFEGGSLVSTWLHRIAVNAALMKLRTRRRKPEESIEHLLPVYKDDVDNVVGILHAIDLIKAIASGRRDVNAASVARDALTVPETMSAADLL